MKRCTKCGAAKSNLTQYARHDEVCGNCWVRIVDSPSLTFVDRAMTQAGGWTKAQLAEWGVPWPPPKGWKAKLDGELNA